MQSEDAKYLKRKIRSRAIDVHPTEQALVVNYELEALILGDLGDALLGDKKECQKIIRLKSLNASTDCVALAKQVVEQCSLIHPTKLEEVEHLICYLQKRKAENDATAGSTNGGANGDTKESSRPSSSSSSSESHSNQVEKASITNIEEYVELLYEDINQKVKGSAFILHLARNPDNLYELGNNESVLSALARVLREDWKQSIDLATNIVYIFFCFSKYSIFHTIILQYKVGSLCMEVIDSELRRYDQLKDDLEARRCRMEGLPSNRSQIGHAPAEGHIDSRRKSSSHSAGVSHIPISHIPISHIPISHIPTTVDSRRRNTEQSVLTSDSKRKSQDIGNAIEEAQVLKEDYEGRKQKFKIFTAKQDQLLRVSFFLLMNIAENTKVEDKMRKKNIVGMLAKALDRENPDLLILVTTFLQKLSFFRENVDDMRDLNVIEMLPRILTMENPELMDVTLRLLFNLSFDMEVRDRMVRVGFLPKLVSLLGDERFTEVVLKLLYHLSIDDRCKTMFVYTDCVATAMTMLLDSDPEEESMNVIALCVNLAINKRSAQMMVDNDRLEALMTRAFHNQNSLIMKIIRNIAEHESTKQYFVEFVGDIAKAIVQSEKEDFVVECVGVLGNMTLPDLDFKEIMKHFELIPWVLQVLVPGKYEDDLVLDVVVLLGTAAADQGCAKLLCKADVLFALIELLKAKQEDDEMVLQIIYVFYQVARHSSTLHFLVDETDAPAYLVDLMHDKNVQIRKVCNSCLDIIAECNKDWEEKTKVVKFRWHNSQWLEMVESNVTDDGIGADLDDLPSYQNDLLDNPLDPSSNDYLMRHREGVINRSSNLTDVDEDVPSAVLLSTSRMSSHSNSSDDLILGHNFANGAASKVR